MIEWNTVKYIDCMDKEEGLPSLPDKCIDLGYTDPPWGNSFINKKKQLINFEDKFKPGWNLYWFYELERICKAIILVISYNKLFWWIRNTKPIGLFILHLQNGRYPSKISQFNRISPYLVYGKLSNKLFVNVRDFIIPTGFLNKNKEFIHSTPKGLEIALRILDEVKPQSLIDPFTGSGSYLKSANILGIKWLGYEINPIYKQDIDKRFSKKLITEWIRG